MWELPDRLGERFALGPLIGQGTCSRVYRAHDQLLDREAAVKVFPVADDPRVQREIQLLASLDHPSLVGVYDVGQVDGRAFVVMALFEGGSLADRLRRGPLPLDEAVLAVSSVADALAHVHRAGVLHRDVTPRNVLFDVDGRAHLSDFGVAFVADTPRITDTGIVVGSAPYLSPEQVRGEEVGPPADVYSLGLVMIEALTARPAFVGTPLEAAVARLERSPELPPGLGDDVATLLTEMTADAPADRPDAESVRLRLRRAALAREAGTPSGPQPVVVPSPRASEFEPTRLPTRALMVIGAAAMSVLLAGTVVVASTWTVRDVSASANPPASLSPAASAPLGQPLAAPAPDRDGSGAQDEGSAGSTGSSASGSDGSRVSTTPTGSSSGSGQRASRPSFTEPVTGRPAARADTGPRLATPPPSSSSAGRVTPRDADTTTTDSSGSTEPTGRSSGTVTPSLPLPDLGDVTKNLPVPTERSSSSTSSTTSRTTSERSATDTTTSTTSTSGRTTSDGLTDALVDPSGTTSSTPTTSSTTPTTTGGLQALSGALG